MNIFKYEFKTYIKSILIWSIAITALLMMYMAFYPTFGRDTAIIDKMLSNYPKEMLKVMGMDGGLPLSSVLGYFSFTFVFAQLCLAMQSSNYGFHFLSVEERELTADFLMSKPVSRHQIIVNKFLAVFLSLLITNFFVWIGSFAAITLFRDGQPYEIKSIVLLLASTILFQLFFVSVGMLISVSVKKIRSVLAFSMGLSFGLYILNALKSIIGGKLLGILTPFYHFEPGYILEYGKFDMSIVSISIGVIVVCLITSYVLYKKRNIHSL